jgi:hypothetical protein
VDDRPRYAIPADRNHFMTLVEEFVKEGTSPGMVWGPATEAFFGGLFDEYTSTWRMLPRKNGVVQTNGVVVLCRDGFSLAGGVMPYNSPWGKTAAGWGTYVKREARRQGLAGKMRQLVIQRLKELGFCAVTGGTHPDNAGAVESVAGFNWQPLALTGISVFAGPACNPPDPERQ